MKKKILSVAVIAALVLTMAACGVTTTSTTTHTETHTDANGNTTTTTTTTSTQNGKTETTTTVEETPAEKVQTVADITFQNDTGFDIVELYFSSSDDENWSVDILEATDYGTLSDGSYVTFEKKFKYTAGHNLWDMKIVDENGDYVVFDDMDISVAADPENITFIMAYNSDSDSYSVTVE